MCLLSIYFWLWLTGVDAWPPVNHSYHIHHLRIHFHTTQHPSNHPCTSAHFQMQHFRLSRLSGFPFPFFSFFLFFPFCAAPIYYIRGYCTFFGNPCIISQRPCPVTKHNVHFCCLIFS